MFINWDAKLSAKDYEAILKTNASENGFATKLLIVDDARYFDGYEKLTEEQKNTLIDYVYSYYVDCDNPDVTTYKLISYTFENLIESLDKLDYSDFEQEMIDNVW